MSKAKYAVVGGTPIRMYTGTTTYASLSLIDVFDFKDSAERCASENYERCGGLISVFKIEVDPHD